MKRSMTVGLRDWRALGVLVAVSSLSTLGFADEVSQETSQGFAMLDSMAVEELDSTRGKENVFLDRVNVQSIQDMDAATIGSGNVTGDMVSGAITFEKGALGHYSGTGIFSNVTGNGNAINNAIGISIYISNPN
ncbi:hypothetical protein BEI_3794 [Halomonas beimenensis]|uniref:Uncharacterized protein n=2 Tax=Halomonas beimenensis TaxID=475662 RepID=A0A291PD72_9GAMM|nr:hypothetical protein BEI_3794 [Halomonas beimenensis]